ncbi:hypothetical protein FEM48_Zijuj07G0043300 [Ziziphus jujuba var. spinosa]|uniref:Cystatin domain-containing protein n=1 Tax=Ziziphus jujuba var. spinosa TaxID=714518 RepID=A0A978V2E7_ZIZJJ|nr:hypothetical protein FEM48_Zijuj07G0043300 [Ziziphus jujuba var. spinosa]
MALLIRSPAAKFTSVFLSISILFFFFVAGSYGFGGGRKVGGWTEIEDVKDNEEVQNLGKFSVEEYNRNRRQSGLSNGGGELVFSEVVEAKRQVVSGIKYHLKVAATMNGETKMFDSVVVVKPWTRSKQLIEFSPRGETVKLGFEGGEV